MLTLTLTVPHACVYAEGRGLKTATKPHHLQKAETLNRVPQKDPLYKHHKQDQRLGAGGAGGGSPAESNLHWKLALLCAESLSHLQKLQILFNGSVVIK